MTFERIGPYALTRRDLIAASLVISFRTGSASTRWKAWLFVLCGVVLMLVGALTRDPLAFGVGFVLFPLLFIVGPGLRSLKYAREIYLSYSDDGLVADTALVRTTYKWSTLGATARVGTRLFIMVSSGHALVLRDAVTTEANMRNLIAAIEAHRSIKA